MESVVLGVPKLYSRLSLSTSHITPAQRLVSGPQHRMSLGAKSLHWCPTLWSCGWGPTRLHCPWNSPGKNTAVGCLFLLQAIFPTQGSNLHLLCLLQWQVASLPLVPPGKPQYSTQSLRILVSALSKHPQGRVSVYALHPLSISLFIFMPWKLCSLSL